MVQKLQGMKNWSHQANMQDVQGPTRSDYAKVNDEFSHLCHLVVFQSVPYKMTEVEDVYVDGGFLCNYPIHAFDGEFC